MEDRIPHGTAEYPGPDDALIGVRDFVAVLRGPSGGQYEAVVALPSVGAACVTLRLALSVEDCRDGAAEPIACPELRIADEPVFAAVQVSGDDVNVCIE